MNTILGNTAGNTWKRTKLQHIALVCGLVISASAAVALSWQGGAATTPSNPVRASFSTPRSERAQSLVVFVADSQRQSDDHAASIRQDLDPAWFDSFSFVVVTNANDEADLLTTLRERLLVVSNVHVVDLRVR